MNFLERKLNNSNKLLEYVGIYLKTHWYILLIHALNIL